MYNACEIKKTCSVCKQEKNNLDFQSNRKGRTELKPFCKTCKPIYVGIKGKLLNPNQYIGKNFDTGRLNEKLESVICIKTAGRQENMSYKKAVSLVKQGGASVISSTAIKCLHEWDVDTYKIEVKLRQKIYNRDNMKCHYCGEFGTTLDHVHPRKDGGMNTLLNLVCSCRTCNQLKGEMSKVLFLKKIKAGVISEEDVLNMRKKLEDAPENFDSVHFNRKVSFLSRKRKCCICTEEKIITKFEKKSPECRKCEKFITAFKKGWIAQERLISISTDSKMLKSYLVKVIKTSGEIDLADKLTGQTYLKKGIAEILDRGTIRLLFTEKQIEEMHPKLLVPSLQEGELMTPKEHYDAKKVTLTEKELNKRKRQCKNLTSSSISVFMDGEKCIGTLSNEDAQRLILSGDAIQCRNNRIAVEKRRIYVAIHNLNTVTNHEDIDPRIRRKLLKKDTLLLHKENVPVYTRAKEIIGIIPLGTARKLVLDGSAIRGRNGSIILVQSEQAKEFRDLKEQIRTK